MTSTLALVGKSGSGKTTLVKAFTQAIKKIHPEKSILLVDNDLTCQLASRFGLKIHSTIYGIRSGKHEYNTGIPKGMTKQEYIEWALEDIVTSVDQNVDIIVSWLVASKDCRCPITTQMNIAVSKFIEQYDFVIFDCEFDLKYLNQLVDYPIDTTLIVTNDNKESIHLASEIHEFSKKYALEGQLGVLLNRVEGEGAAAIEQINAFGLDFVGIVKDAGGYCCDNANGCEDALEREKSILEDVLMVYPRLNLPQEA